MWQQDGTREGVGNRPEMTGHAARRALVLGLCRVLPAPLVVACLSRGPWGAGSSRLSPLPALRAPRNWFLKETRTQPGSVVSTLDTSVNGEATPPSHVLLEEGGALGSLALGVPSVRGPCSPVRARGN